MSDFQLVDPKGWEYDLQSVYSAYIGHFQLHNVPWYERSWGYLFASFETFLAFSWPVITVTDARTGRAHIVTRLTSIGAFLKMIKTRFGETLPQVDNMLKVKPFETSQRVLRAISDRDSYKKIHSTLPATVLAAMKVRVRAGEVKDIRDLWAKRDKTFLSMSFEWSERNTSSCLEWGYAALRCGHLDALGCWPPDPDTNYRKGHYIVTEYVDKVINKHCPTFPWHYTFGESNMVAKSKLPQIIQAVISSLASPDSETTANNLVLVSHGTPNYLARLEEMKIKVPHNVLLIDTANLERNLFFMGERRDAQTRGSDAMLALSALVHAFRLQPELLWQAHNAGNDALVGLYVFQKLLDPEHTATPSVVRPHTPANGFLPMPMMPILPMGYFPVQPGPVAPWGARLSRVPGRGSGASADGKKGAKEDAELSASMKRLSTDG